ncbi:MAG TPA: translation initiation factor IF-6 [Acidobacteriota bacterium]|nr:translation initiation factor IF-6 [Acidobacteriota bacterium]
MSSIAKVSIQGNPNVGLYVYACDDFALVGNAASSEDVKEIQDALKVPVHQVNVCGTSLVGIFVVGTKSHVIVPSIIFDDELAKLQKIAKQYKREVLVLDTKFTALGNIMAISGPLLITNNDVEDSVIKQLKTAGVQNVLRTEIADTDAVGSALVFSAKGGLVHPDISNKSIEQLEKALGFNLMLGTVNWGSPYVRSGVVCNSHGFLIGTTSSGPEVRNTDEALGFFQQ